jgi:hypothetical protein
MCRYRHLCLATCSGYLLAYVYMRRYIHMSFSLLSMKLRASCGCICLRTTRYTHMHVCVDTATCAACLLTSYVSIRQHTSAYVSIRQHTSAYVSIRQHTSSTCAGNLPVSLKAWVYMKLLVVRYTHIYLHNHCLPVSLVAWVHLKLRATCVPNGLLVNLSAY